MFYLFVHGTCHWQTMFDLVFVLTVAFCSLSRMFFFSFRVILVLVQLHIDFIVLFCIFIFILTI